MKYILTSVVLLCTGSIYSGNNVTGHSANICTSSYPQHIVSDTAKKYIFLTFDDGPQAGTMAVYNVLRKEAVKGTFFMVGLHSQIKSDGKEIVNTIRQSYPQTLLANHSYSHANNKYFYFYHHPDMALQDFLRTQELLSVPYKIIRLPGNSAWVQTNKIKASPLVKPVCGKLDSAGYNIIGWDVEWSFDHKTANPVQTPEQMLNIVENALSKNEVHSKNCIVILSHDRMFRNPNYTDSLSKFIGLLKQHSNYVFETIDRYPGLKSLK